MSLLQLRRFAVLLIAGVLSLGTLALPPVPAYAADPAATCLEAGHVWVVVDKGSGSVTGGCATDRSNGLAALSSAGFTVTDTGGFICQIDNAPATCASSNKEWWSYFHRSQTSPGTFGDWEFSNKGATNYTPLAGSVEGWRLTTTDAGWPPVAPNYTPPTINPPAPDVSAPVSVPDAGFRTCLNEALGQPANAPLTKKSLAGIKKLSCFYAGIADLTGAEHLTEATEISLEMNKIVDITPLSGLTKLTTLSLDTNQISDASAIATLPNLTSLDLDSNRLTTLAGVAKSTRLTTLRVSNQQISKVPTLANLDGVQSLTELRTLETNSNAIADLTPLKGLKLTTLLAFNNKITDLTPVGSITTLTELNVHTNPLSSLDPLATLTALSKLNARSAGLTSVGPLPTLPAITVIDLSKNPLTDASRLRTAVTLTDVGLDTTGLTDASWLADLPALTWFIGHNNAITDLSGLKGKTMKGWGVLTQVVPLKAVAGVPFSLPALIDQTGVAITPVVPKGVTSTDGSYAAAAPGTYTFNYSEQTSGAKYPKFVGKIVVTVAAAEAPTLSDGPKDITAREGESATFHATATGTPAPVLSWETSTDGVTWAPAQQSSGTVTSAAVTDQPTLTLDSVTLLQNGLKVRAIATNVAGTSTSAAATLTVTPRPVVVPEPEPSAGPSAPGAPTDQPPAVADPPATSGPLAATGAPPLLPMGLAATLLVGLGVAVLARRKAAEPQRAAKP